jgi:hypothetical protein
MANLLFFTRRYLIVKEPLHPDEPEIKDSLHESLMPVTCGWWR